MSRLLEIVDQISILEKTLIKQDIEKSKSDYKLKLERLEARKTDKQYTKEESEYIFPYKGLQRMMCDQCEYFRPKQEDNCLKVIGKVSHNGHCKFWEHSDIEKAIKGGEPIGTIKTHKDGRKYKKVSQTGNANTDWKLVTKDKTDTKEDTKEGVSNGEQGNSKVDKKDLVEHAKNTSEQALNNAIKQSPDSEVRKIAHEELDRRTKEEHVQDDKKETKKKESNKKSKTNEEVESQIKGHETKEEIEAEIKRLRNVESDDINEITDIINKIQELLKKREKVLKEISTERKVSFEEYRKGFKIFNTRKEAYETYYKDSRLVSDFLSSNKNIEESIDFYKASGYRDIREFIINNEVKREGESPDTIKKVIDNISKFINDNKINENISLNRRVNGDGVKFFKSLNKGDIYEDKSFSSTSLIELEHFGEFNIEILAKKGSSVANLDNPGEYEYLIDEESKFRVLDTSKDGVIVELL